MAGQLVCTHRDTDEIPDSYPSKLKCTLDATTALIGIDTGKHSALWSRSTLAAGSVFAFLLVSGSAFAEGGDGGGGGGGAGGGVDAGYQGQPGQNGQNSAAGGGGGGPGANGGDGNWGFGPGGAGTGGSAGTVAGTNGAAGGDVTDTTFAGGGGGGGGAHGYIGATIPGGTFTGGDGGRGGNATGTGVVNTGGDGGGGGAGGYGAAVTSGGTGDVLAGDSLTGGQGGTGGDAIYQAGDGGDGGAGLAYQGSSLAVEGNLSGGIGGSSGNTFSGAHGGAGGVGLILDAASLIQSGHISGGNGGTGDRDGSGGAGINVVRDSVTIINSGLISGGMSGDTASRANAIVFAEGANRLELRDGSTIIGNVDAIAGTDDTFVLGGGVASVFDVSAIGDSAQYRGFETFEKTGASTWKLTGTVAAMTPWTIIQGALSISSDANLGNAAGGLILNGGTLATTASISTGRNITLSGNGEFDVTTNTTLELSGYISGAGDLVKTGSGSLRLTGNNAYRDTVVEDGYLIGNTASIRGNIRSNGEIIFDQTQNDVYAGQLSGNGAFTKLGNGALLLNGDSSAFLGTTTVEEGKLIVADANHGSAMLGGTINVLSGATLGGYGSVGETTVQSGGILSPGNSIGTLTVDGDLTLKPGSALEIEIASSGASDRVDVAGTAIVSGSNVSVTTIDPETSYQNGQLYHILTADGGISGEFAGVVSNSAFLDMSLAYDDTAADLKICLKTGCPKPVDPETPGPGTSEPEQPSPALFTTVAQTRNQLATAGGLDTLAQTGSSLALYNTLLMLSAGEARAAFDSLSGEAYASATGILIDDSRFIRNAALGRLQQAFGGAPATPINALSYAGSQKDVSAFASAIDAVAPASIAPVQNLYTAWGYAYGAWTRQDNNGNAGAVKSSVGGFVTGIDGTVLDTWRLGLLAGYSHSSFDVDDRTSSGSSDNYTLGAYAGTEWTLNNGHALAFRSGLAYTWHNVDMNRSVAFPGFADNLTSDYDAGSFQLFGELGYNIHYGKALFEPYAGLAYVRLKTDGFDEKGQTAATLAVQSGTTDTSFSTLGLRASTEFVLGTIAATARADLGWRHAYGDITPVSTASFIGSDAFTVSGIPIAEDAALIEAGLDFKLTEDATLGLSYNGQFASGAKQNGFNAKLSVSF